MTDLDFTAAVVVLAELRPGSEDRPCAHCRVMTREELLVEADVRLWPMDEICEACSEALLSDLEDEHLSERELRQREAAIRAGGTGDWLDES